MKAWQLYLHVKVQPRLFNFSHSLKNLEGKNGLVTFLLWDVSCNLKMFKKQENAWMRTCKNMQEQIVCLSSYSDNIHNIKIPLSLSFPSPAPPQKRGWGRNWKHRTPTIMWVLSKKICLWKSKNVYE